MNWSSMWLKTRIAFELYSVEEEDVAEWTFLRRNPLVCSALWCPITEPLKWMLDQSHLAVWPYEVFSALVCVHHDRTSGEALCCFMPTSMACDELACCPNCCCIWARLVLSGWNLIVRGTIFRSSAVPDNKQSCWVFHVLGESCTTIIYQIWSGVFFQWLQLAIVLQTST